jgi:methylenetetrahydrofolate dehydrogenase (NADP+)/methenyltetrahydrofolate cyclohydrolase
MPQLLFAKPVAESIYTELKKKIADFTKRYSRTPKLVVVLVGEDPASIIYTTKKTKEAQALGMESENLKFPASVDPKTVLRKIEELNLDPKVDGVLIQRPLPGQFDSTAALSWVAPEKDVDCFHPENVGRLTLGLEGPKSCTPFGVMKLLSHYGISVAGKKACVVGRSAIVGKPMAALLLNADATLIQVHSRTSNLTELTKQADVLVVAAGKPKMIRAEHVKSGAVVIDVGIHRQNDGKLCGDVDFESVSATASAITPVPGGVGPMTIATLLSNTVDAAFAREKRKA